MDAVSTRYRDNPSFSSTLLDEIYRSIDERDDEQLTVCRKPKQTKFGGPGCFRDDFDERRACLVQKWMENKVCEKAVVGRKSAAADLDRRSIRSERDSLYFNSSSSSSGSSSGGGFSSSEGELMYGVLFKPRPVRTNIHQHGGFEKREKERCMYGHGYQHHVLEQKVKHESKFVKTKSKALKLYSDLKKVKQPISPGGRLSTFLNSLFTTGNTKKSKMSSREGGCAVAAKSHLDRKSKSANASTCSSASSFSRSCLSNTPSSRGNQSNGLKRSVRFYPVSEIVDEYCQPCGHKSLHEEETSLESVKFTKHSINEEIQIKEAARNLLTNYQKKVELGFDSERNNVDMIGAENVEDGDGSYDGKSDSSSDLFELDNLSAIGMHKYREELPVYETTNLDTNRAIANSLLI
ncbi:protein BIG GRAIN 1-like A [Cynara cardunculus var. scolymus]|uniref:Protein BIG GRAIN 1-like B n=1 Tax=Cynara cardunculus var. scolymus TaxID=59895 RepID=A0A103XVY2_CYNCS|nr:protein BIG GRAIN 1-like A [Cynara cardunculus var. scolymus]KVH97892.1 hypothetical protein Ccrd_023852 [Cynara cardunculus var. scolymus]